MEGLKIWRPLVCWYLFQLEFSVFCQELLPWKPMAGTHLRLQSVRKEGPFFCHWMAQRAMAWIPSILWMPLHRGQNSRTQSQTLFPLPSPCCTSSPVQGWILDKADTASNDVVFDNLTFVFIWERMGCTMEWSFDACEEWLLWLFWLRLLIFPKKRSGFSSCSGEIKSFGPKV